MLSRKLAKDIMYLHFLFLGYQPEPYDEHNQLCCGSQLVDKFDPISGFERTCCKGKNETQFPGRVVEEGMTCCGGNVFDGTNCSFN